MDHLSKNHKLLIEIVFQKVKLKEICSNQTIPLETVHETDLNLMAQLIQTEFNASLQKEIENSEESEKHGDIHRYDVYLVEPSFRNRNINIAVAIPKPRNKESICWYDENNTIWESHELTPKRKVSSLSGTVRVLDNILDHYQDSDFGLMRDAMNRTKLFNAADWMNNNDLFIASNAKLNPSQNIAVNVVKSQDFTNGFFVVQGPPGTGKSTTPIEMICSIEYRVIASAPSNAATSHIALKLFKTSKFRHMDLCVYGSGCDDAVAFLNPSLRKVAFDKFISNFNDESDEEKQDVMLRKFCEWLHLEPDSSIMDVCSICNHREEECFELAQIVCCTLNSSGSTWLRDRSGARDTFFLDEAGQTMRLSFI